MKKRICFVTAIPRTAQSFLRDHIAALSKEYDIYLAGNINGVEEIEGLALAGWYRIDIERGISIRKDLKSIFEVRRLFKKEKFDAVHSVTPKAGMVTAIAGKMAGIKHRTHIFTGQVWCTRKGLIRMILKSIDKIIARLDNHILVDGKSQRDFLIKEGVLREGQAQVFGNGSISGVNFERFVPNLRERKNVRSKLGIKDDSICFVFLGRLTYEKGIRELYEAFNRLAGETNKVFLLLIGDDEGDFISHLNDYSNINQSNCYYCGRVPNPEIELNAGDVFVLPTYREGFGTSVLEAASIGLPAITSNVYGVLDAVIEGETGFRCKVGDIDTLYECMKKMCDNPDVMREMGVKSRKRVLSDFNGAQLTEYWMQFYDSLLNE